MACWMGEVVALIWLGAQLCRAHGHIMYIPMCSQCRSWVEKQMRSDGGDIKELVVEVCGSRVQRGEV